LKVNILVQVVNIYTVIYKMKLLLL